jgi:hypothetical protein
MFCLLKSLVFKNKGSLTDFANGQPALVNFDWQMVSYLHAVIVSAKDQTKYSLLITSFYH